MYMYCQCGSVHCVRWDGVFKATCCESRREFEYCIVFRKIHHDRPFFSCSRQYIQYAIICVLYMYICIFAVYGWHYVWYLPLQVSSLWHSHMPFGSVC